MAGLIRELRKRRIFRVAAAYAVIAWIMIQVVVVTSAPLNLPAWFPTAVIVFLGVGFPIALVLAWAFDFAGPAGLLAHDQSQNATLGGRSLIEIALLLAVVVGIVWLVVKDFVTDRRESLYLVDSLPIVVLMDTYAPRGVYDEDTRQQSRTNADLLNEALRDLPIVIQKEAIGPVWDREVQILSQKPDLVVIHRSGFFHAMNLELDLGYPDNPSTFREKEWRTLYDIADNKLMAILGFIGQGNPKTKFLVYSRGTSAEWADEDFRNKWISRATGRFPALTGRITALLVPGGVAVASFHDPETVQMIRTNVEALLQLDPNKTK